MTYTALYADGTSEVLLSVPKYDFNWQITYELATPKRLPKGTKVEVVAHYDNSAANKYNPDPRNWVGFGNRTTDDMARHWLTFYYMSDEEFQAEVSERAAQRSTTNQN
jgi:hypothetical protein